MVHALVGQDKAHYFDRVGADGRSRVGVLVGKLDTRLRVRVPGDSRLGSPPLLQAAERDEGPLGTRGEFRTIIVVVRDGGLFEVHTEGSGRPIGEADALVVRKRNGNILVAIVGILFPGEAKASAVLCLARCHTECSHLDIVRRCRRIDRGTRPARIGIPGGRGHCTRTIFRPDCRRCGHGGATQKRQSQCRILHVHKASYQKVMKSNVIIK